MLRRGRCAGASVSAVTSRPHRFSPTDGSTSERGGDHDGVEPSTEFVELAQNEVNGRTLASLAVSEGAIFLRSESHLYRIETPGN